MIFPTKLILVWEVKQGKKKAKRGQERSRKVKEGKERWKNIKEVQERSRKAKEGKGVKRGQGI